MVWAAMSSAGVGPLCFLKSTVNAAIYQEILEHFMIPSADKLYGDADFILQAGGLTGLRRAVGVCGEGGVGRRNALRGERVWRRAGKQWASEWWLTPVSVSSDCRREFKSAPPAARRESSAREQMRTSTDRESPEEERESPEEDEPCLRLFKALFCVIKHPFLARHPWLPRPSFPDPRTLLQLPFRFFIGH